MKKISFRFIIILLIAGLSMQSCTQPIDKSIIEDITHLENTLLYTNTANQYTNGRFIKRLEKTVIDYGNKPADVSVLNKASSVRVETSVVYELLSKTRSEIISATGGYIDGDVMKGYKGINDVTVTEQFMLGNEQNGKAYLIKTKLDECVDHLNKISGRHYPKIEFDPMSFKGKPMILIMANLNRLEAEILKYESNQLDDYCAELGC